MKRPYTLSRDDRADASVRIILRFLFDELQSNVAGVLEDEDIEHLHDFRVAIRRIRTVLSQIRGVFAPTVVGRFAPEFKWRGTATGPCRDLDVTLLDLEGYPLQPGIDESALAPVQLFLETRREGEHHRIAAALESARFRLFAEEWRDFLSTTYRPGAEPPSAPATIFEVAGPRILKAVNRIRKRGSGVDTDAPAATLHRLRIDGKKLRYLLEFFSDLYPRATVSRFIEELKQLQDILGEFNDTQVQLALLETFAEDGMPSSSTHAVIDTLLDVIKERERGLRTHFTKRFALFASDESRRLYTRTFKTR